MPFAVHNQERKSDGGEETGIQDRHCRHRGPAMRWFINRISHCDEEVEARNLGSVKRWAGL